MKLAQHNDKRSLKLNNVASRTMEEAENKKNTSKFDSRTSGIAYRP